MRHQSKVKNPKSAPFFPIENASPQDYCVPDNGGVLAGGRR